MTSGRETAARVDSMADGTPRRGSTIAAKIAAFRSLEERTAPLRLPERQDANQEQDFWWLKHAAGKEDVQSRGPARPGGQTSEAQHPPEPDLRRKAIDQSAKREGFVNPGRSHAPATGPPSHPPAVIAALQRLAQEHPSLYHAVMSLERGPDGRLSDTALGMISKALGHSGASSHDQGADARTSTRQGDAAGRQGAVHGSHVGVAARHAAAGQAGHGGHTTTTFMAQQPHRWQGSAAGQGGALAATQVPGQNQEEPIDSLLARYRPMSSTAEYLGGGSGPASAGPSAHGPAVDASGTSARSGQISASATGSARPASAAPALAGGVTVAPDAEGAKGGVHRSRPVSQGGESDSGAPGPRRRSRSSSSPERRPRTAPGQAQAPGGSAPPGLPMPPPPTSRDSAAGEKLQKLYRLANIAKEMAQREGAAGSNAEIGQGAHGASGLTAGEARRSPGRGQTEASAAGADDPAGSAQEDVRDSQARERFQRAAALATAVTAAAVAAAGTGPFADAGRAAAGPARSPGPGPGDGPGRADRSNGGGSASSIGELVSEPSLASYHSAPVKDAATAAAAATGAAAAAVAAAAAAEVAARALEEQQRQQRQQEEPASVPPAEAAPAAAAAATGVAASASRAATVATAAAAAANPSFYQASNPDAPAARRVQFSPNQPQVRLFMEGSPPTAAAANPPGMPTGLAGTPTSPSVTSTGHSFPGHSNPSFSGWAAAGSATGVSSNPAPLPTGGPAPATSTGAAPGQAGTAGPQAGAPAGTTLPSQPPGQPSAYAAAQPAPAPVQQVYLVPSQHRRPNDPNAPKPTHIFIPADPGLPPALVAVPGFEPLPRRSLSPPKQGRRRSQSGSPSRHGGSATSSPGRTSPEKTDKAAGGAGAAGVDQGSPGASGSAAGGGTGGRRERTEVDKLLDSDSEDEEGQGQGAQGRPGGSPGRPLSDLDVELQARAQAAAQAEREASSYTRNRLSRLMDQVSAFRRVEGERQMREGERIKMLGEFKSMSIDQLTALLGADSALLKEINAFRELYTGNLQLVQQQANEHTRAVLGALQQASDTAVAVKEAVVEATLQQQQEMMEVVDKVAAAAPPPPPPLRSPLLQMSTQTLFSGLPTAPSELVNPSWWRTLLDPANRAVLDAAGAGAGDPASGPAQAQAQGGALAPELRLAQRVAGVASAIRSSLDRAHSPGGLPGGGLAVADGGGLSVDAITQAARQVSLTLDVAVREFLDRRSGATAHGTPAPGDLGSSYALSAPGPGSPAAVQAPLPYAGLGAAALQGAAVGLMPMQQPPLGSAGLGLGMQPRVPMLGQVIPPGLGSPGMMLPGSYMGSGGPIGAGAAMPGASGQWVAQPVALAPLVLPDGTVLQQPLTAAAVLPGGPALQLSQGMPHMQQLSAQPSQQLQAVGVGGQAGGGAAAGCSVVAFGPPASTAAAALQPQLVAVHGPLPAGGASAAAIANLPTCGPAAVLPGGGPGAGLTPCHGPTYMGAAPGGMVRVPPGGCIGPMPGEGLPCRMDVQLAAVVPAAPPGSLPVSQQQQQRHSQEQLGDQQHAVEERMDHHTAQQQGYTQPIGTYLTATYQEQDDQVSYDQYTWPHGEEALSARHAEHPGAWHDKASAREVRPPWSQANDSRVGGSTGVHAGTGPAAGGPGGVATHSTYDYLLVSHPSISTRPSTSGGAGGGYEGGHPGTLGGSGSDAVAALASALAGAMGLGSGPPSTVGTDATGSRATARRTLHFQTPGDSSGSGRPRSSDRDAGRWRDGGSGADRSERAGRSISRGGEGREHRESRFARGSSGGRDSRSASRSPSRPHSSPERAASRSGRRSSPSRSSSRPLSGEGTHGERDRAYRSRSREASQSPSRSPSRPESHAGSRPASRASSRMEAPWLTEHMGYRTGSIGSEAGRQGRGRGPGSSSGAGAGHARVPAAAAAAARASEPREGLDSSAAASEASLKTGVAELPRRRRGSQSGQVAGAQALRGGQDQLQPGPSSRAPAPPTTAPQVSAHVQRYLASAPAQAAAAAEAQNQQQRWQDMGGGAGPPSVPPRAEALASVPVPGVAGKSAAVLYPPAMYPAQDSYAAALAAGPVAMQLLQQQQTWWGQQQQRAASPPPAAQPLHNAASAPLSPHQPLDPAQVAYHPQPSQPQQQQLQPTSQQHSMPTRQAYHPPPVVLPGSPTRLAQPSTDPAFMPAWPRVASAVPPGYGIQQDALARGRMVAVAAGTNLAAAAAATPGIPPPVTVIPPQPHTRMIPLSMQRPSMVAGYPPPGVMSNPYNRMPAASTSAAGAGPGLAQRAAAQSAQEALTAARQGHGNGPGDGGFAFSPPPRHSVSNEGSVPLVGSSPTRTAARSVAPSAYGSAQGMASPSPAVAAVAAVAASATSPGFARSSYGQLQAATGVQAPHTASPTAQHPYYTTQQPSAGLLQSGQLFTAQASYGQGYPGGQVTGMPSAYGATGTGHTASTQQPSSAHVGMGASTAYQGTGMVSGHAGSNVAAPLPLPEAGTAARVQEVARAYDETMMQLQAVYTNQGRG